MAKKDTQENEYTWDSGTYQTGATQAGKRQSGLITGLLIAVIFLGGLASALGLMNVRLLSQLMKEKEPVLPLSVDSTEGVDSSLFGEKKDLSPAVPEDRQLDLIPGTTANWLPAGVPAMNDVPYLAMMTVKTGQGQLITGPVLVLSADGYLLTNAHLVTPSGSMTVQLHDGRTFSAALVATDIYSDLSVLYIEAQDLTPATFAHGDTQPLTLHAMVNGESLSAGEMGEQTRSLQVGKESITLRQTDFDTDHGPVFDGFGHVQGFLCRSFGDEDGGMMLGVDQVMKIAEALVEQGAVSGRPGLGLQAQVISTFCRQYWGLSHGLEVVAVEANGAAKAAGLMNGDILLTIQGNELTDLQQLYETLFAAQPGEHLTLEVFRAGRRFTVTVSVTKMS